MNKSLIATAAVVVVAAGGAAVAADLALRGTDSTTTLDQFSTVMVDGGPALDGDIVAGRTASKYHPLPWIGKDLDAVSCPGALRAVAGSSITCTGRHDGATVNIPVTAVSVNADQMTWKFSR